LVLWSKYKKMQDIIDLIMEICEDSSTPKNVKEKMNQISIILQGTSDQSIRINKALNELDEIGNDNNMQQFTRTQIYEHKYQTIEGLLSNYKPHNLFLILQQIHSNNLLFLDYQSYYINQYLCYLQQQFLYTLL
jgi:uncharacterized protein (UPF0147 family)